MVTSSTEGAMVTARSIIDSLRGIEKPDQKKGIDGRISILISTLRQNPIAIYPDLSYRVNSVVSVLLSLSVAFCRNVQIICELSF